MQKKENAEKVKPNLEVKTAHSKGDLGKVDNADATCMELKVGMTIAVERQNYDEHFNILDLKMYHHECEDGFMEIHKKDGYHFTCKRCNVSRDIAGSDADEVGMVNTALKGEEYSTLSTHLDLIVFILK